MIDNLHTKKLVYYNHYLGTTDELWNSFPRLNQEMRLIATSVDHDGFNTVAIIEYREFPFYGVLFHPETTVYFKPTDADQHTEDGVKTNIAFANFFVNEARKNDFRFDSNEELSTLLIENDRHWFGHAHDGNSVIDTYIYF